MSNRTVVVSEMSDKYGMPAAELVNRACNYSCEIKLVDGNRTVNAKSLLGVMAFFSGNITGKSVKIQTNGEGEEAALDAIDSFLTR